LLEPQASRNVHNKRRHSRCTLSSNGNHPQSNFARLAGGTETDIKLNILMISDVYFPRVNGVSTSITTFRCSLRQLGHSSTLIAPAYPQGTSRHETDIVRIPARYLFMDPEDR
jgi:hypothetical protein